MAPCLLGLRNVEALLVELAFAQVLAFEMGEQDKGEECFRHFIRIRKSKGSSMDKDVAHALFVLGSHHLATTKRDLAQDCWVKALKIVKGLGRTDGDPSVKSLKKR